MTTLYDSKQRKVHLPCLFEANVGYKCAYTSIVDIVSHMLSLLLLWNKVQLSQYLFYLSSDMPLFWTSWHNPGWITGTAARMLKEGIMNEVGKRNLGNLTESKLLLIRYNHEVDEFQPEMIKN